MAQWIVFHLTDRCPRTCLHCLRDPAARATDLPLELFERALDQVGPLHGVSHVGLTGGEPLIHPQFAEVMGSIARRGFTEAALFQQALALGLETIGWGQKNGERLSKEAAFQVVLGKWRLLNHLGVLDTNLRNYRHWTVTPGGAAFARAALQSEV